MVDNSTIDQTKVDTIRNHRYSSRFISKLLNKIHHPSKLKNDKQSQLKLEEFIYDEYQFFNEENIRNNNFKTEGVKTSILSSFLMKYIGSKLDEMFVYVYNLQKLSNFQLENAKDYKPRAGGISYWLRLLVQLNHIII